MSEFSIYNSSGEIHSIIECPPSCITLQIKKGDSYITGNHSGKYIKTLSKPMPVNRPVTTTTIDKTTVLADGIDMLTLSNIPINSTILVKGGGTTLTQPVNGTSETITFDLPGTYTVCIQGFPYLDYEVTITAT